MKAVAEGKRRAKAKATGGTVSLADNCSFFLYSGEDLICQKDLGAEVVPDSDSPEKVNGAYYQPKFLLTDHLGTTRAELMFDPATLQPKLAKTYDTMPYGELISIPTGRSEPVLFSGKPRDNESGLDYFGARYYISSSFRWSSTDPGNWGQDLNPQSWNLYSYVLGNPLKFVDPDGHLEMDKNGNPKFYKQGTATQRQTINDFANGHRYEASWPVDIGYVKTDKGREVRALKTTGPMKVVEYDEKGKKVNEGGAELVPAPTDNSTNCHGTTFAKSQLIIGNAEAQKIVDDEYTSTTDPKSGDVGIYKDNNTKGIVHSVTVASTNGTTVTEVISKGGVMAKDIVPPGPGPGTGWQKTNTTIEYKKKLPEGKK